MNNLEVIENKNVAKTFQWKDRKDNFYNVEEMETRHLFFTLRMIWNHSAPKHLRLSPYKKYLFKKFYTNDYFKKAIKHMLIELTKREDIPERWLVQLNHMVTYAQKINEILLIEN